MVVNQDYIKLAKTGSDMHPTEKQRSLLRSLPGVDHVIEQVNARGLFDNTPKSVVLQSIRTVIDALRREILADDRHTVPGSLDDTHILARVTKVVAEATAFNLVSTINATGVVIHTNLGRSLLAREAADNLLTIACNYSNLEFDLATGRRGSRYSNVEDILCEISGAEGAMVVNNNAGAVLICLETLARNKQVVVSRGELVEIGGAFRIPDVMARSGGILHEVGTTNRTHPVDFENAITRDTALLLKVHTSNYAVVGFTAAVSLKDLVAIGRKYHLPVMEDLGSGTFIDFSLYGLMSEPTIQESLAAGVDVVTFSGDKLLGGPQAGIILGKKEIIDQIKKNPITRALRIDKLTLAALESTLRLYRDKEKAVQSIPTLRMLLGPFNKIELRSEKLAKMLEHLDTKIQVEILDRPSKAGGGSLPLLELPSKCVALKIKNISADRFEKAMRTSTPPVIGRIEDDFFIMDMRTILDDELEIIQSAVSGILKKA